METTPGSSRTSASPTLDDSWAWATRAHLWQLRRHRPRRRERDPPGAGGQPPRESAATARRSPLSRVSLPAFEAGRAAGLGEGDRRHTGGCLEARPGVGDIAGLLLLGVRHRSRGRLREPGPAAPADPVAGRRRRPGDGCRTARGRTSVRRCRVGRASGGPAGAGRGSRQGADGELRRQAAWAARRGATRPGAAASGARVAAADLRQVASCRHERARHPGQGASVARGLNLDPRHRAAAALGTLARCNASRSI